MKILQVVWGKSQLVTVSDHSQGENPYFAVSISVQVGDKMVDYFDVKIDPTAPNYWNMSHNDYWNIELIYRIIEAKQRDLFEFVMRGQMKNLALTEWLVHSNTSLDEKWEFVQCDEGGFNIWLTNKKGRDYYVHCHTLVESLDMLWVVCHDIDKWAVVDGGYREEESGGVGIKIKKTSVSDLIDLREKFNIFAVPRLSKMKDMVALVLIGYVHPNYKFVVWYDGRLWHTRKQYLKESGADVKKLYSNMKDVIDAIYEQNPTPSATVWQMRQQTGNGRFDTILTQHWNDGSAPERLAFNDAMQARLNSLIYKQWLEYDDATRAENWKFARHEYGMVIWHTDSKSSGVYARCSVSDGLDILWTVCKDANAWLLKADGVE